MKRAPFRFPPKGTSKALFFSSCCKGYTDQSAGLSKKQVPHFPGHCRNNLLNPASTKKRANVGPTAIRRRIAVGPMLARHSLLAGKFEFLAKRVQADILSRYDQKCGWNAISCWPNLFELSCRQRPLMSADVQFSTFVIVTFPHPCYIISRKKRRLFLIYTCCECLGPFFIPSGSHFFILSQLNIKKKTNKKKTQTKKRDLSNFFFFFFNKIFLSFHSI